MDKSLCYWRSGISASFHFDATLCACWVSIGSKIFAHTDHTLASEYVDASHEYDPRGHNAGETPHHSKYTFSENCGDSWCVVLVHFYNWMHGHIAHIGSHF